MASDIFNTGQSNVTGAFNTGKDAIGSFDPNAWASTTQKGLTDMWGGQNKTQADYIQGFKDQILGQPTATSLYNKANDMFNVPTLQNNATMLNNTMLQTPNSNLNAAKGFNFDNNQVQQKTSQDLQRLAPVATAATNAANTAENLAGNYVTRGMEQNAYELQPVQEQGQYLMDSYARQQSGFTTVQQSQLDSLKAKMQAGVQLSSDEMAAFSQLSSAESSYQSAMAQANASVQAAKINNQNVVLPQGATYINPSTGRAYNPFATPARP